MTGYRQLMRLALKKVLYRQIATRQGCLQRTIAKVPCALDKHQLTETTQIETLSREDIERLFSDDRKSVTGGFVPVDIDKARKVIEPDIAPGHVTTSAGGIHECPRKTRHDFPGE